MKVEKTILLHIKDAFNLLMSNLKKKNPRWDRNRVGGQSSAARSLFTEENSDGENV